MAMGWKIPFNLSLKSTFITTWDSAIYASTIAWGRIVITAVTTSVIIITETLETKLSTLIPICMIFADLNYQIWSEGWKIPSVLHLHLSPHGTNK